jgi:DNA-binding CsgD family transcriptional regulator
MGLLADLDEIAMPQNEVRATGTMTPGESLLEMAGVDLAARQRDRRLAQARAAESTQDESVGGYLLRRSIPFVSPVVNFARTVSYGNAKKRLEQGKPEESDYQTIAEYERLQEIEQNRSLGGKIGSALAGLPSIIGEAMAGGAALRGVAAAVPRLGFLAGTTAARGATLVDRIGAAAVSPSAWGRTAAQTVAMPSMWLPEWADNNVAAGRSPTDLQGAPPAFAMGFLQTAVFGSLKSVGADIPGQALGKVLKRNAQRVGIGMLEQQAIDVMAGVSGLRTGYGLVGDILQGKSGDALQHAIVQAVTFAAFAGMHEIQDGAPLSGRAPARSEFSQPDRQFSLSNLMGPLKAAVETANKARKQGLTPEAAGKKIVEAQRPVVEAMDNPQPTLSMETVTGIAYALRLPTGKKTQATLEAEIAAIPGGKFFLDAATKPTEAPRAEVPPTTAPAPAPEAKAPVPPETKTQAIIAHSDALNSFRDQLFHAIGRDKMSSDNPNQKQDIRKAIANSPSLRESLRKVNEARAVLREQAPPEAAPAAKTEAAPPVDRTPLEVLKEAFHTAGLTEREQQVLLQRGEGKSLRQIEGMSYETARADQNKAIEKLKATHPASKVKELIAGLKDDAKKARQEAGLGEKPATGKTNKTIDEHLSDVALSWGEADRERSVKNVAKLADDLEALAGKATKGMKDVGELLKKSGFDIDELSEIIKAAKELSNATRKSAERYRVSEDAIRRITGVSPQGPAKAVQSPHERQALEAEVQTTGRDPADVKAKVDALKAKGRDVAAQYPGDSPVAKLARAYAEDFGAPPTAAEKKLGRIGGGQEDLTPAEQRTKPGEENVLAHAHVDARRVADRLAAIEKQMAQSDPDVYRQAMDKLRADPQAAEKLVDDILTNQRTPLQVEEALLLHRMTAIRNERSRNTFQLLDAYKEATLPGARARRTPESDARLAMLENQQRELDAMIDRVDKASSYLGSETGRALRWRQLIMAEDFSLAGMIRSAEVGRGKPFDPKDQKDQKHLETIKKLQEELAELKKKIDETGPAKPGETSGPAYEADFAFDRVKKKFATVREELKEEQAPPLVKAWRWAQEFTNLPREILASIDFAALRQGMWNMLTHPVRTSKRIPEMLRAFANPEVAERAQYEIENSPMAVWDPISGLDLTSHTGPLKRREEGFMSRLVGQIPLIGKLTQASGRGFHTFLNRIRRDSFDALAYSLAIKGELTPSGAKVIGTFVNETTGRGTVTGGVEKAAGLLGQVFFAHKWAISRFQVLTGHPIWSNLGETAPAARKLVAQEYARFALGVAVAASLAKLAGMQLEGDPRSTDFGKAKTGNTRLDFTGGLASVATFMSRQGSGTRKNAKGQTVPLVNPPYGQPDAAGLAGDFLRAKLAPFPSAVLNVRSGENVVGQPTTLPKEAGHLVTPLFARDLVEAWQDLGIPKGTAVGMLGLFGMGMQTYNPNAPRERVGVR